MDESRYFWGAGGQISDFNIHLGAHAKHGDFQRRWTATNYTVDVRGLEIPPIYFDSRIKHKLTTAEVNRRIGNVNDNGEAYPPGWEGPDLYFTMTIPPGHFVLSVYEMNDDGHKGKNALRDYTLELSGSNAADDTVVAPPCIARDTDFYNGVYKRFLVQGPMDLSLIVRKNQSLNAEVSAIMLDQPTETPAPYFTDQQPRPAVDGGPASQIDQALRTMSATHPKWWAIHHHQLAVALARWCQSASPSNEGSWQFASACYFANLFPQLEKTQSALGLRPARAIEKSLTWDQIESDSSGHETRDLKIYLDGQKNHP